MGGMASMVSPILKLKDTVKDNSWENVILECSLFNERDPHLEYLLFKDIHQQRLGSPQGVSDS